MAEQSDGLANPFAYQAWVAVAINSEAGARRWSDAEVARRAGIPKNTLGRYLRMERHMDVDQMSALAAVFGMSVAELAKIAEDRRDSASLVERANVMAAADRHLSEAERMRQVSDAVTIAGDIASAPRRRKARPTSDGIAADPTPGGSE